MCALSGRPSDPITARCARWLALAWSLGAALGCHGPQPARPPRQLATVHARSTDGQHVAGVRLWADGRELGATDASGRLETTLQARDGARVVITAACPSAYRTLDDRRELALRPLRGAGPEATAPSLQLTVRCEPLEVLAALVVRMRGESVAGLPVRVRERVVGQTGPDGTAHLVLRARPATSVAVQLDTSSAPDVQPHSPVQSFELGTEPSVLVFERTLERPRRVRRGRRPAPSATLRNHLPYRVQ